MAGDPLHPYRDAHGNTEETLVRVSGLATALYELTREHSALNNPEPLSNAILSLAKVLEEMAEKAADQHGAESSIIAKQGQVDSSAANEMGK